MQAKLRNDLSHLFASLRDQGKGRMRWKILLDKVRRSRIPKFLVIADIEPH